MQTPFDFFNELLRSAAQDQRTGLGLWTIFEKVVPFATDLTFLKPSARPEVCRQDVGTGGLDATAHGLDDPTEIGRRNSTGAKDVTVGKVLGG